MAVLIIKQQRRKSRDVEYSTELIKQGGGGAFWRARSLKRQALKQRVNSGAAAMDSLRKVVFII